MKRIPVLCWLFAAALFLWSIADFYHYAVIGPGVINYYDGMSLMQQLVNHSLWMGIIKLLLGATILLAGWFIGKKQQETATPSPRLQPYFVRRIGLVLASLWLISMLLLTVGTAQYVLEEIVEGGYDFPEDVGRASRLEEYYPAEVEIALGETLEHRPGGDIYHMLEAITMASRHNSAPDLSYYPGEEPLFTGIYRDKWQTLNTAILFMDNEENILHQSGDFFYFNYATADTWAQQSESTDGYAWVDLGDEDDPRYSFMRIIYEGVRSLYDWEAIRMTGYFDGSRFEPLTMARADYWAYADALDQLTSFGNENVDIPMDSNDTHSNTTSDSGSGSDYTMSQLDAMGLIAWEEHFDYTAHAPAGQELVTIYGMRPEMMLYDSAPVRYEGLVYDDLVTLLATMGYYRDKGSNTFHQSASQISLWNTVVFGCRSYWDFSEYDFTSDEPRPDTEVTMMTAVQASPLKIAASYLRNVYLLTAALVLIAFWWLRSLVKKHLSAPLTEINQSITEGWVHLPSLRHHPAELTELQTLTHHYQTTQNTLNANKNEIARLSAALSYAEKAEENRRQMTSHIAHELKTPLAVIHSYTEGLQERIAEEKREKYLEVILSETERMDGMVLEMLDLSRLEAGRVKLAQDEFSLLTLCRGVFDKLELALQAKELHVTYTCFCDDTVTADESRIRQVMENFATNAIKHTPMGGEIRVQVTRDSRGTTFAMENDGENLPAEVLGKVWDSFWRQDESRSSPGTGLGLAICKGIIILHGGVCEARNTVCGVEFRFRI